MTLGLAFQALSIWLDVGEFREILRWSQTVVDLADGDPAKGAGFGVGSPLAIGLAIRGVARWWLGHPGWRQDLDDAFAMAQSRDATTLALVVSWTYGVARAYGVLRADDVTVRAVEEAVKRAERTGSDTAVRFAEFAWGMSPLYRMPQPAVNGDSSSWCRSATRGCASVFLR